ncbi:MAG TPA: hypothetical protein VGM36_00800 [Rhizomicrobium sp.]
MHETQGKSVAITCKCGKVVFGALRSPVLTASCYCSSCQKAGHEFENLSSAPNVQNADGGTPIVLYRKDRVQYKAGKEFLAEHRLKPDSPTRRVIATCCNSPMFLDFTKGHWLSIYRQRLPHGAPPIEMRIMTKDRRADVMLQKDVPNYDGYPGRFMLKLILAWIAMGFSRPDMGLREIPRFNGGRKN